MYIKRNPHFSDGVFDMKKGEMIVVSVIGDKTCSKLFDLMMFTTNKQTGEIKQNTEGIDRKTLAESLKVTRGHIENLLRPLRKGGWVKERPDPKDGRKKWIQVSLPSNINELLKKQNPFLANLMSKDKIHKTLLIEKIRLI